MHNLTPKQMSLSPNWSAQDYGNIWIGIWAFWSEPNEMKKDTGKEGGLKDRTLD